MHNWRDKLIEVHDRLQQAAKQAQRDPKTVRLLAVSKTQDANAVRGLFAAGQRAFGENYLQEALDKQAKLADLAIEWHFIGPIQSNKTQAIASHFDWVHSLERLKIAERLDRQRPEHLGPLNVCIQINLDQEPNKSGISLAELPQLAAAVASLPRLRLRGLMAIPEPREQFAEQLAVFQQLQKALLELQTAQPQTQLDTLSMGMSGDLEAAVAAGATWVRVGTALFGPRAKA